MRTSPQPSLQLVRGPAQVAFVEIQVTWEWLWYHGIEPTIWLWPRTNLDHGLLGFWPLALALPNCNATCWWNRLNSTRVHKQSARLFRVLTFINKGVTTKFLIAISITFRGKPPLPRSSLWQLQISFFDINTSVHLPKFGGTKAESNVISFFVLHHSFDDT